MPENGQSKKDGLVFIVKSMLVYATWVVVRKSMKGFDFLYPTWVAINDFVAEKYVSWSASILELIYPSAKIVHNSRNIFIKGMNGVFVGDHCLGISAMFIFTLLIAVLKGKWKYKIGYILLGLLVILAINMFRIITLAMMLKNGWKDLFHLNHNYSYLLIVYGIIFGMVVIWERVFSRRP